MNSLNVAIVGGMGRISQRLTKLLVSSTPPSQVKSIIRHQAQVDAVRALSLDPTLGLITPIVLSLDTASVQEFTDVFTGCDVVYFIAGWKPGENNQNAEEITKKVDYEGAVKVFDAIEAVKDGATPHLIMVSALDIRHPEKIPEHYTEEDIAMSERLRKDIPSFMHWKYEADKNLAKRQGFKWTIVRPGGLTEDSGTGKVSIGRTHLGTVSRDDVAKVLFLLATRPKAAGLAIDLLSGPDDVEKRLDTFVEKGETDFLG